MNNAVKLVDDLKKFISETPELDDAKDLLFIKMDALLKEQSRISEKSDREFTFDLHEKWLKQYYSATSPENAWRDARKFMIKNGFTAKSDTDYISNEPLTSVEFDMIKNSLRNKYPWFEVCTKKIISSDIDDHYDTKKEWELSRSVEELSHIKEELSKKVQEAAELRRQAKEAEDLYKQAKEMKKDVADSMKNNKKSIHNASVKEKTILHNFKTNR